MNAKHLQDKIGILFSNHDHQFLNKYIYGHDWESDFFSVTKTGYCYEVEVKISRSDFKVDFNKFKHKLFEGRNETQVTKPAKIKRGRIRSKAKEVNPQTVKMPNKFFFACPEGLIKLEEIPEYAGLIYVGEHTTTVIKQAPFLHKNKENIKEFLFSKYQYSYLNAKDKLDMVQQKFDTICRGLEQDFNLPVGSVKSMSSFRKLIKK